MSQTEVERLLGRLITDAGFRERASRSLHAVCFEEGMVLSAQELALVGQIDFSLFARLAEGVNEALRRTASGSWKVNGEKE